MPVSENVFDDIIKELLVLTSPRTLIDIGPGAGKYGKIAREIEQENGIELEKTCVEVDLEKIIKRFELEKLYNRVICEDAARLPKNMPELVADVVILGDVIEHLTKSEGIDLIEYLQYRARHIFLVIPVDWFCVGYKDYDHEAHISIWRIQDIEWFSGAYCVERHEKKGHRFLLAAINGIAVPQDEHIVVREKSGSVEQKRYYSEEIEFGYLNDKTI